MLPLKLRLLLFYLHKLQKVDYPNLEPAFIRSQNEKGWKGQKRIVEFPSPSMFMVENREISMRDSSKIPVRIYQPSDADKLKTVVYYHGGGFVLRNLDSHDDLCRRIAKKTNALVISVGYRLAPEFKFPIPAHDAYDALVWASENCQNYGGNPEELIVMGDSAGGNLAAVTCFLARDEKGPIISKQVLIYPCVDARWRYPSIEEFKDGYLLTKTMLYWFTEHYANNDEDLVNPLMSPILAESLADLPPAFVSTSDHDPLKDEGEDYFNKLLEVGNQAVFKEYKNTIHAFANLPRLTKQADILVDDIAEFLR